MHEIESTSETTADTGQDDDDYVLAEFVERPDDRTLAAPEAGQPRRPPVRRRRDKLPLILFLITCLSTFIAGAVGWIPTLDAMPIRRAIISHWQDGLIYMACILAILLTRRESLNFRTH